MLIRFLCSLGLLLSTTLWAEPYEDITEHKFEVQGMPDLVLRNPDGVIQINPRSGPTVEIKIIRRVRGAAGEAQARKELDRVSLDVAQTGNQVRAIARWRNSGISIGSRPAIDVRFEVYTPPQSNVRAEVSDGEMYITKIQGNLDLSVSDGELAASDLSGDIRISASDGDVELKQSSGTMDLSVSDGDLRALNCSGRARIRSGDGRVELSGYDGEIEISTGDGDVLIDGVLRGMNGRVSDGDMWIKVSPGSVMQSSWTLKSGDGEIILDLPDDFSADLEVTTGDGRVQTEHPVTVVGALSSHRLTGKIRDGGTFASDQDIGWQRSD
jgi:hypothetical protein